MNVQKVVQSESGIVYLFVIALLDAKEKACPHEKSDKMNMASTHPTYFQISLSHSSKLTNEMEASFYRENLVGHGLVLK